MQVKLVTGLKLRVVAFPGCGMGNDGKLTDIDADFAKDQLHSLIKGSDF
ncbi:hypothetical protein [Vibrio sp. TRT 17S01]